MQAVLQALLQAILPSLLGVLQTPAFQAILKSILDDLVAKIISGVSPTAATQQAVGAASAAAALHLSGSPIADIQKVLAGLPIPINIPAVTIPSAGTTGLSGLQSLLEQLLANLQSGSNAPLLANIQAGKIVLPSAPDALKFTS